MIHKKKLLGIFLIQNRKKKENSTAFYNYCSALFTMEMIPHARTVPTDISSV